MAARGEHLPPTGIFSEKLYMEGNLPRQQLLEILGQLDHPRLDRHKKYLLLEILFLTVSAVLSGFEDSALSGLPPLPCHSKPKAASGLFRPDTNG